MVATSQPLAAQAGLEILQAGGNAADAAIATAAMLNVVEPISTGIGGDCFALYWDAKSKTISALNGSGRAAGASSIEELRGMGYTEMPTFTGHSVSIPGTVAGWSDLLGRHGRMSLADVLQPAIRTAEEGYPVTEWIANGWATQVQKLLRAPGWQSGDLDNGREQPSGHELLIDGRAPRAGEIMRIPTLGATMRVIAAEGKAAIYQGEFARKISEHVQRYGGWITPADMAAHVSTWDEPIVADINGVRLYECPPNGQGLTALIALRILEGYDLAGMPAQTPETLHLQIEAMRLAFADAARYIADPRFRGVPVAELLSDAYIAERRALIQPHRVGNYGAGSLPISHDTVYVTAVDAYGNAVSFIISLYMGFGSGVVAGDTGIAMQNRGACFVLDEGHPNMLEPGKRPYHTIIPCMVTKNNELWSSFGVMGGFMQPQGHMQMLVNMIDHGMNPQESLDAPRFELLEPYEGQRTLALEHDAATQAALAALGHEVVPAQVGGFGGGQIIGVENGVAFAGSDPRKDGSAVGL